MLKLVIFDFDGTLVNTFSDCVDAFNEALTQNGFPARNPAKYQYVFGRSLPEIMYEVLPENARDPETVERLGLCYKKIYGASEKPKSIPFPGIESMLKALKEKGIRLAVQSNKAEELLSAMTDKLFPGGMFDAVMGFSPDRRPKPAPDGVFELMERFHADEKETVYVGDGRSDMDTAHHAGIPVIAVTWGQGKKDDLLDPSNEYLVRNRRELKKLLLSL